MASKGNPKSETFGISVYLPPHYYFLARVIADKNQEPLAALLKRLLLPALDDAASASFKTSNAILNALKNNELSPPVARELTEYLARKEEKPTEELE